MAWVRMTEFIVQLRWLTADEGGRVSGSPQLSAASDSEYRGVWVEDSERAWSFFVHPADPPDLPDLNEAARPYPENGASFMAVGQEFAHTEGPKRDAEGRIVRMLDQAHAVSWSGI